MNIQSIISSDNNTDGCFVEILPDANKLKSLFYFLDL